MAGQGSGRLSSEYSLPAGPKLFDVESTQTRDLDVDRLSVRCRRLTLTRGMKLAFYAFCLRGTQTGVGAARHAVDPIVIHEFESSFSFRRLRTTPAKKPRTECCCQPVAFIIAAIVAPVGDCSIAITCDCFEARSGFLGFGSLAGWRVGFRVGAPAIDVPVDCFLADLDIRDPRSV